MKETEETDANYPWVDQDGERRYMSDKEILEKYVDWGKSYPLHTEKKGVIDMLYKYADALSLSGEIGTS